MSAASEGAAPEKPRGNASNEAWVDYIVAAGIAPREDVERLGKSGLRDVVERHEAAEAERVASEQEASERAAAEQAEAERVAVEQARAGGGLNTTSAAALTGASDGSEGDAPAETDPADADAGSPPPDEGGEDTDEVEPELFDEYVVRVAISGLRNGEPWPAIGERMTLPVDEGEGYVLAGYVELAED